MAFNCLKHEQRKGSMLTLAFAAIQTMVFGASLYMHFRMQHLLLTQDFKSGAEMKEKLSKLIMQEKKYLFQMKTVQFFKLQGELGRHLKEKILMDFHVRVNRLHTKLLLFLLFYFSHFNYAFALGDIIALYDALITYIAFFISLFLIISKLRSVFRIKAILLFLICFFTDFIVSLKVTFQEYRKSIIIFTFFNTFLLLFYIFYQIKKQNK